jgi:hypothetical protein
VWTLAVDDYILDSIKPLTHHDADLQGKNADSKHHIAELARNQCSCNAPCPTLCLCVLAFDIIPRFNAHQSVKGQDNNTSNVAETSCIQNLCQCKPLSLTGNHQWILFPSESLSRFPLGPESRLQHWLLIMTISGFPLQSCVHAH